MNIFNSQADLKAKAKHVLGLIKSSPTLKHASVFNALLTDHSKAEFQFAKQVTNELANRDLSNLRLSQMLQILAKKSNNLDFQTFKAKTFENKLDARNFLKIKFSVGHANWISSETEHPFPPEFKKIPALKPWKKVWEEVNVSTQDRPFLVPAMPAKCFEGENFQLKQYQDWSLGERECTTYGNASVIVYCKNKTVGAMKWYWWGGYQSFKASDFTFYLRHRNSIISSCFDVRPSHALPTFGPKIDIVELSSEKIDQKFKSIEGDFQSIRFKRDDE